MFNSTHTFVGLALARAGFDRWVPHAAVTAAIAANLPDIEILSGLAGTPAYLEYHRGITHTFIGIPILSLALTLAMYIFSGNFWKTFVVAFVAMATHPALDYLNTYGLRPFLPFDDTWYYGDTLFIFDPYLDAVLLAGILIGRRFKDRRDILAWISLACAFVYIGVRVELRNEASAQLDSFVSTSNQKDVVSLNVMPQMTDPREWDGIIETQNEFTKVRINSFQGFKNYLAKMPRGTPTDIVGHAATSEAASAFLRFARFPATRVEGMRFGYRVTFIDFRFYDEDTQSGLAAEVLLDQSLVVVKDNLSFTKELSPPTKPKPQ